jgi:hypothetical protein
MGHTMLGSGDTQVEVFEGSCANCGEQLRLIYTCKPGTTRRYFEGLPPGEQVRFAKKITETCDTCGYRHRRK